MAVAWRPDKERREGREGKRGNESALPVTSDWAFILWALSRVPEVSKHLNRIERLNMFQVLSRSILLSVKVNATF